MSLSAKALTEKWDQVDCENRQSALTQEIGAFECALKGSGRDVPSRPKLTGDFTDLDLLENHRAQLSGLCRAAGLKPQLLPPTKPQTMNNTESKPASGRKLSATERVALARGVTVEQLLGQEQPKEPTYTGTSAKCAEARKAVHND